MLLERLVEFLRTYAGPTGARGSILLMAGGLVVLGFLFLVFIFRSAVVGDLAPAAHRRGPAPTVLLPPTDAAHPAGAPLAAAGAGADARDPFAHGRKSGRDRARGLDEALAAMPEMGLGEARVLLAKHETMHVRVYAASDCERARGYLVGALERLLGAPVKVDEVACRARGAAHCEFLARHPRREVRA